MKKTLICMPVLAFALLAFGSQDLAAQEGGSSFAISGDVSVTVEEATAQMVKIGGRIPAITISSSPASIRKLGTGYSVNLFFSGDFDPKPGKYPIAYSYRKKTNTLGGSFIQRRGMFSHDTNGTAEFIEFGEQVRVRFEFETFDESEGTEGRQRVMVKGEAVCARADIF